MRVCEKMANAVAKRSKAKLELADVPATHHDELKRVNRLIGQLEGVKRMIEDRRYCVDILTQTRAVSAALRSLEGAVLRGHMKHCLRHALTSKNLKDANEKIEELVHLFSKQPS